MGKASRMKQENRHSGRVKKHGKKPSGWVPLSKGSMNDFLASDNPGAYAMKDVDVEPYVRDHLIQAMINDDLSAFTQTVKYADFANFNILDISFSQEVGNAASDTPLLPVLAFLSGAVNVLNWFCSDYLKQKNTQEALEAYLGFSKWLLDKVDRLDQNSSMFKLAAHIVQRGLKIHEKLGLLDQSLQAAGGPIGPIVSAMVSAEKAETAANAERCVIVAEIPIPAAQPVRTKPTTPRL